MIAAYSEVCLAYDGWVAVGPFGQIGATKCVKRRYERGPMWCEVWLQPVNHWHDDYPNKEIRRQLDNAKEYWAEYWAAREYARMC